MSKWNQRGYTSVKPTWKPPVNPDERCECKVPLKWRSYVGYWICGYCRNVIK